MTLSETSAATREATAELHATLARTEDYGERQRGLLKWYGRNAEIQAHDFLDGILARRDLRPGEDLAARGQVVVDAILKIALRANAERGLDFPEFTEATKTVVEFAFFSSLNKKLALAITPPAGSA